MVVQYIINAGWLAAHLNDTDIVVVDCRFELQAPQAGRRQYEQDHIPGAVYFDLEEDLSAERKEHGGRHPLPELDEFTRKLGSAGIDGAKHVVAYDDQNGSMAARLWWLLRYAGHENVSVLGVSYSDWKAEGYPTSLDRPVPAATVFEPRVQTNMALDIEDVKQHKDDVNTALIDSRAPERYRGEKEPMDAKAGHIPGAANWFWQDNVGEDGKWKSREDLASRFEPLKDRNVIVYCGSGVSAAANALAMKEAGLEGVQLYVGSWSDWSSYDDLPAAKGDETRPPGGAPREKNGRR